MRTLISTSTATVFGFGIILGLPQDALAQVTVITLSAGLIIRAILIRALET